MIHCEKKEYRGWKNAWQISNGTVEVVVLADVGPRIVRFALCGGENQFHEFDDQAGLAGGEEFRLYGGHRLWVWPEVERTYFPDNHAVEVAHSPNGIAFCAPIEAAFPGTRLRKQIEIRMDDSGNHLRLIHTITNHGADETVLAAWTPTVLKPGGRAILPFPPRAAMDKVHFQSVAPLVLWSFTDFSDSRWLMGADYLQLIQSQHPLGRFPEQMSGLFVPDCWGAYWRNGDLFLKRTKIIAGAQYPDFGCNFEVFTNAEFLELETLGPIIRLKPGESTIHTEHWWLFTGITEVSDDPSIRSEILPIVQKTDAY